MEWIPGRVNPKCTIPGSDRSLYTGMNIVRVARSQNLQHLWQLLGTRNEIMRKRDLINIK
jgi:hypothetical protein